MALKSIFKKEKRANVMLDSFFYFLAIIIFIIVAITGSYVLDSFNTEYQNDPDASNESKVILADLNTDYPAWFDYGAGAVLLLLWALVLVASFYIDTHPVFFMIAVIVLAVAIFAINQFMSGITDYLEEPEIASITQNFPISMFVVNNVEKVIVLVGFTIALALYAKYRG